MKIRTKFNIDDIVLYDGKRQIIFGITYWVDRNSKPWLTYILENDVNAFENELTRLKEKE